MTLFIIFLSASSAQDCAPTDDCDGDGWTSEQGDCDEEDASINPGAMENCFNEVDDDCDGLFNQGCDAGAQQGALWGGSTCRSSDDPAAALFLLPLLGFLRKRRC